MEGKGPSDLYAPTVSFVSPVNQVLGAHTKFFRRPLPPLAHLKYIIYILGLTRSRTRTRGYNLRFAVHRQYRDASKAVVSFAEWLPLFTASQYVTILLVTILPLRKVIGFLNFAADFLLLGRLFWMPIIHWLHAYQWFHDMSRLLCAVAVS